MLELLPFGISPHTGFVELLPQATKGFCTGRLSCNVCTCGIYHTLGTECHTSCAAWGAWQDVEIENCWISVCVCVSILGSHDYVWVCNDNLAHLPLKWLVGERATAAGGEGDADVWAARHWGEMWCGGGGAVMKSPLLSPPPQTPR